MAISRTILCIYICIKGPNFKIDITSERHGINQKFFLIWNLRCRYDNL